MSKTFGISHDLVAGQVFEDLGHRPVRIRDEAHLRRICEKTGQTSVHLQNKMRVQRGHCKFHRPAWSLSQGGGIKMAKSGAAFAALTAALSKKKGKAKVSNPKALAAWIGRKKYGAKGMAAKSAAGRRAAK